MHAIILMGGAAASETLIGGYICTIGGCSIPQKQPRENTASVYILYLHCMQLPQYGSLVGLDDLGDVLGHSQRQTVVQTLYSLEGRERHDGHMGNIR